MMKMMMKMILDNQGHVTRDDPHAECERVNIRRTINIDICPSFGLCRLTSGRPRHASVSVKQRQNGSLPSGSQMLADV